MLRNPAIQKSIVMRWRWNSPLLLTGLVLAGRKNSFTLQQQPLQNRLLVWIANLPSDRNLYIAEFFACQLNKQFRQDSLAFKLPNGVELATEYSRSIWWANINTQGQRLFWNALYLTRFLLQIRAGMIRALGSEEMLVALFFFRLSWDLSWGEITRAWSVSRSRFIANIARSKRK